MAEIALPRQQVTQEMQSSEIGSPLYQRRLNSTAGPIELIPNPHFSFPQRAPELSSSAPSSTPGTRPMSIQAYPAGRRGSTPGSRQKSVSALPDFSFNPAGPNSTTGPASATPPHSPLAAPTTPSQAIRHRRGGSEFIGGDGRSGANLLSSSPTKTEGMIPPPTTLRPGPPAGRRGHAHRRSGAISSHDLSAIMRGPSDPQPPSRAGSAPVTPMDDAMPPFGHTVNKSVSQPSLRTGEFNSDESGSPRRPPSRARVGFSDKIEYIRPLSTISSETETSLSTFRGHSATGSLSSVISIGTSSPPSVRGRPSLNTTLEDEDRPKTAGAVLDKYAHNSFGGSLFERKRPTSSTGPASLVSPPAPSPTRIPGKRLGFFRLESRKSDPVVTPLPSSASDPSLSAPAIESPLPSPKSLKSEEEESMGESEKPKTSTRKNHRAPRKVKSWANSIISRKGKQGHKLKGRAPTPPPIASTSGDEWDDADDFDFEANFDVDNTVTIVSPTSDAVPQRKLDTDIASWKPRELKRVDSDSKSPVIDLDAALGPFNTPQGPSPRSQQRGFGAHRRAMHSAGGLLQPHRRTESAPELVPFEHRPVSVGSTSAMADVFEEEEPEDEEETNKLPVSPSTNPKQKDIEEPKIEVVEADGVPTGSTINWNFDDGLGIQRVEKTGKEEPVAPLEAATADPVAPPLQKPSESRRSFEINDVEVVEDYEEPRASSLTRSSDSTVTPTLAPEPAKEPQSVVNISLPLPQSCLMTPDTFASSFSSPDFRSSQASFDTPRLGTAASSITDYRAMPSPQFGEPGPEVRISVDDVPSLTSSRSTMTSGLQNAFPLMSPRRLGDRSASLCSMPGEFEQVRRKRSSIASLSRLINSSSSFGEKSKLSIEQRPQSEYLEPSAKEKTKKHKRLSKLINFWRPKEGTKA